MRFGKRAFDLVATLLFSAALLPGCHKDSSADPTKAPPDDTSNKCGAAPTPAGTPAALKGPGDGFVQQGDANGKVTLDFSKATAGAQFVLMPYVLGATATIDGSNIRRNVVFDVTKPAAALLPVSGRPGTQLADSFVSGNQFAESALDAERRLGRARDHDKRTLLNRFDPTKGMQQSPGFWRIARQLDTSSDDPAVSLFDESLLLGGDAALAVVDPGSSIEAFYRKAAASGHSDQLKIKTAPLHHALALDAKACPSGKILTPGDSPGADPESTNITPDKVVDGGDFCIVYVSPSTTEPDTAAIQNSIKTILSTYKNTVYKDQFATTSTGYPFKPVYVFINVGDSNVWNPAAAYNLAGVFFSWMAKNAGMPLIYIASDFKKVTTFASEADANVLKAQVHSVMAHETQHAILDFYRRGSVTGTAVEETIPVDEGVAHYMEDLFGYGDDAFAFWAKPFLDVSANGIAPFLVGGNDYGLQTVNGAKQGVDAGIARSSSHALMYYLSSQKGGVTCDSTGTVTGGGGLDYIVSVVKEKTTSGPTNLSAKFGSDWALAIGHYLGAVAVDNLTPAASTDPLYTVQAPAAVLTDLQGGKNKVYGMRFNNYKGIADHLADYTENGKETKIDTLSYYMTKPILYTVTDPTKTVTFQASGESDLSNSAVSAVWIK